MGKHTRNIKKSDLISCALMFLYTTYSFTSGGIINYIFPNLICVVIVFATIILGMLSTTSYKFRCRNKLMLSQILLCITVILLNRNANFTHKVFVNDFAIITACIFLLLSIQSNIWHKYYIFFSCLWTFFHATITMLEYIVPGLYISHILPLFEGTPYYRFLISGFKEGIMSGLTSNPTSNGMYLSVGLMILSILFLLKKRKSFFLLSLLILTTCALLLTGKRSLLIFSPLSILLVYYIYNLDKPIKSVAKVVGVIMVVLAAFFVSSQYIPELNNFINRFKTTSERGDVSAGRYLLYNVAGRLILKNPLFGIGWDAYKYYFFLKYREFKNTHNVYLQLLAENGIIGAMPFFILFIVNNVRAIREMVEYCRLKKSLRDHSIEIGLSFSVGMQTLFLLYSMTENPLYDAQMFFPYICCVSIGEYYINELKQNKDITDYFSEQLEDG